MHVAAGCEQNWSQCGPLRCPETRARRKGRAEKGAWVGFALGKGVQKTASTDEAEDSGRPMSAER